MLENRVLISGFGGQGVMLIGQLLGYASKDEGRNVTFYPAYGPEQRGGTANCTVVISDNAIASPVPSKVDVLIAMNEPSIVKYLSKVKPGGTVIVNSSQTRSKIERDDVKVHYINADDLAFQLGSQKVANMIMLGAYINVSSALDVEQLLKTMQVQLAKKAEYFEINKVAIYKGIELTS